MSIHIHDTATRKVVPLDTRTAGRVTMYGCGPTVYGHIHIGNARTFLWYDFIRRYLEYRGYDVTYVMNYTDVDDKIIERAAGEKSTAEEVARKYAQALEEDLGALGVGRPDIVPLATEHIDDMVKSIEALKAGGNAYAVGGDVFFSVESWPSYGGLSGRSLDDMRAGERIEPHASKRNPMDFALWKSAKEGEPSWPSPWGPGRPGWHIECSVMAVKYLGSDFDLHLGGADLIFPHHENEVAQAEAIARGGSFARHWMHAGLVQMESEKMSKSIGNVALLHDALERWAPEVLRYWAFTGAYRSQVAFSESALDDAGQAYERITNFLAAARHALGADAPDPAEARSRRRPGDVSEGDDAKGAGGEGDDAEGFVARFIAALDDDLGSPAALAVLHELIRDGNKLIDQSQRGDPQARESLAALLDAFFEITGVLGFELPLEVGENKLTGELLDFLVELRDEARAARDFDRADAIRQRLADLGVALEDTSAGSRWRT